MKLLGISGKRHSGKSSIGRFVLATVMESLRDNDNNPVIDFARISETGDLVLPALLEDGTVVEGVADLYSQDGDFQAYMHDNFYGHCMLFSYADSIKKYCYDVLGLDYDILNGASADRDTPTIYTWDKSGFKPPKGVAKTEFMTYRDCLKAAGEFWRRFDDGCWVRSTFNSIDIFQPELAIITDVRRPNELREIKRRGGKVIRLLRQTYDDNDPTETDLDAGNFDQNEFDAIVANQQMTLSETCETVFNIVKEWGFI